MSRIKLNDIKSTEIDTANLAAVSTDLRECINAKYLWAEERWIIDCEFKNGEQIPLQYDYLDSASCNKDFERLSSLEHVTNQNANAL